MNKTYIRNKEKVILRAKNRQLYLKNFIQRVKKFRSCYNCNESRWWVLDFHHRDDSQKLFNLARAHKKGYSMKRIKEEIKKCDVLCSNCHRDKHYRERLKSGLDRHRTCM